MGDFWFTVRVNTTPPMKSSLHRFLSFAGLAGLLFCSTHAAPSEAVRMNVEFDRPFLPAGSKERLIVKVGFQGLQLPTSHKRQPANIALVIDRSGSMSGDKIEKAREAALELIRRLSPEDVFSLIAYDTRAETLIPARHPDRHQDWEEIISSIRANGSTALYEGVNYGAAQVRRHLEDHRYVNRIILLSDGQANVGPSSPQALGRLGQQLASEGISVTTVGLGHGFNEDLMTRLAQCSDGNTYFAESSSDLPRLFQAELGDVMNVIARKVFVELEFSAGVRPIAFIGREGRIQGSRAELEVNQLYGGQERFALIEVELDSGSSGAELSIVEAKARYEDLGSQRQVSLSGNGRVRFTTDHDLVRSKANARVQADYATNVIAVARDEAVALADANQPAAAARRMKDSAVALSALGNLYSNTLVLKQSQAALSEGERLDREGMDNVKRKAYRAESYQSKSQQTSR
jgi:Ca-activated chloride channel family protein